MNLVIRNARVLTLNDHDEEHPSADIVVRNGRIERIGPGASNGFDLEEVEVIEGRGKLAMPGLMSGSLSSTAFAVSNISAPGSLSLLKSGMATGAAIAGAPRE